MLNDGHILTTSEMQQAEQLLIDAGTSVEQLMLRAGEGAAEYIWRMSADIPSLVMCGPGNNGGDGYVIAQWLLKKGVAVTVAASGDPKTDAAKDAKSKWRGETISLSEAESSQQVIDCIFGTGLTRAIEGDLWQQIDRLLSAADRRVAIDVPSGVQSDTGKLFNDLPNFDLTISLGAYKPAHFLTPSRSIMGNIVGVDIGVSAASKTQILDRPQIEPPSYRDHKYTRGLVAVVAGKMHGAAKLTALAAQQSGAGYVKIIAPEGFVSPSHSIVVEHYSSTKQLSDALSDPRISAIVVGPGLGRDADAQEILDVTLQSNKPMLLDADALVLMGMKFAARIKKLEMPIIATPHSGEFAQIYSNGGASKIELVADLAMRSGAVILAKGSDTVIAGPDQNTCLGAASSSWLSTAGTGDVLSGIIASRMAVDGDTFRAAQSGQWLHSRAAQLAGLSFSPERLIDQISSAIGECL